MNEFGYDTGLHLVVINPLNGNVVLARVFATYQTSEELDQCICQSIPDGHIVVAACMDDCVEELSQLAKDWFISMGSQDIKTLGIGKSFVFIGINGNPRKEPCMEKKALRYYDSLSVA